MLNSNIRCIEMGNNDAAILASRGLNSNIRCIEMEDKILLIIDECR